MTTPHVTSAAKRGRRKLFSTQPPRDDWIAQHRAVWASKPGLRLVYRRWFEIVYDLCVPGASIVELGCGPGFFKECYPEVIATDVMPNPYADRIVDATALPFRDGEIGSIVLIDVFHHLPSPVLFLREAARTLAPGGRLVLNEPWVGLAGRLFYRYLHHEGCDLGVRAQAPWEPAMKDPMTGNAALPFLFFGTSGYLETAELPLRVVHREPYAGLPWLLSGGFQPVSLLPAAFVSTAHRLDGLLSRFPALTATRCFIVVEKPAL